MKVGDVVTMRTVKDRRSEVTYRSPKGELFVFVLLGTVQSGEEFNADAEMESLGWSPPSSEITLTELQHELERRDARITQLERKYAEACALRVAGSGADSERLDWLEQWLPIDPNHRSLTWDRSGREFTIFQSDDDVRRPGMSATVRDAIDAARARTGSGAEDSG